MRLYKKIVSIVIAFLMCFSSTLNFFVLAQETTASPSPTIEVNPTSEPDLVVENIAEVTDGVVSDTNTGENSIEIASPSPSSTIGPIIEPSTEPFIEPSPTPTPVSEISTSDSLSVVEVENNVNSNVINSEFVYHTLNIYLPENGDIDLSTLASNVVNKVYGEDQNLAENVSINVVSVDNFTYVENNITSDANTGGNSIEGGAESNINTGDAYSVVSVLNNINTNVIDSKIHLVTINIFGSMEGNIILPEFENINSSTGNESSDITFNNNATVNNQVNSISNTGENVITTSPLTSPEIVTGNALSSVNILNLGNTNYINSIFKYFYINTLGVWVGDFLGWMENGPDTNDNISINTSNDTVSGACTYCSSNAIGGVNVADVNNNISSTANTGDNNINSSEESNITTGDAYSSVSIVNLVNSNIVNSSGFIGFINIFGSLVGDVGGTSLFEEEIVPETTSESSFQEDSTPEIKETGGILDVAHTNNVGTHVLPGDTVTFMAKIKNIGLGKIYNTKLKIELFKDGKSYGGTYFDLGEINAQKSVKLTTGLVMSKKAVSGLYTAKVTAFGIVGPDDHGISAESESQFKILGFNNLLTSPNTEFPTEIVAAQEDTSQVLGATSSTGDQFAGKMISIFLALLLIYLIANGYQKRELIISYAYRIGSLVTGF